MLTRVPSYCTVADRGDEPLGEFASLAAVLDPAIWIMANSSPPNRATVSVSRISSRSRSATSFRSRSPTACPTCRSLPEAVQIKEHERTDARSETLPKACSSLSRKSTRLGKIGQRVMPCHVNDPGFDFPATGDVGVGPDPSSTRYRLMRLGDRSLVRQVDVGQGCLATRDEGASLAPDLFHGRPTMIAGLDRQLGNVAMGLRTPHICRDKPSMAQNCAL